METPQERIQRVVRETVAISPYDPRWPERFRQEKDHLQSCLPSDLIRRIEHFGSTAVPGLAAKPIIDILVEVTDLRETRAQIVPVLESQGYEYFWRPTHGDDGPPFYAWFIKRDPRTGARTYHIHMVEGTFADHWDRLLFRDYLIEHPVVAREYESLKGALAAASPTDRVAYTRGKTDFIVRVTAQAKAVLRQAQMTEPAESSVSFLEDIDLSHPEFGDLYDELPLWSAPFGLLLLDRVPVRSGLTILDVGAGTGFLTVELAQRCGPRAQVIAVDPWPAATNRLRRKLEHLGLRNVLVLEQDAATLDLPAASIDVVVSNLGINNFTNAGAVLRACFGVAKPDAKLLLTTNLTGHMAEFYAVYRATLIELGATDRLETLEAHLRHRGTVDSVAGLLRDAGFAVRDVITDSFRMRFADGSSLLRHYFVRLGFVAGWKAVAPSSSVQETFAALERNLNAYAAERGELSLTIPMACFEASRKDD